MRDSKLRMLIAAYVGTGWLGASEGLTILQLNRLISDLTLFRWFLIFMFLGSNVLVT